MKNISKVMYRWAPAARLTGSDGVPGRGRGVVARRKAADSGAFEGWRQEAGLLEKPLFVFTGWAEKAAPGDTLEQGSTVYTVLRVEDMAIGNVKVCSRLVLERQVAAYDGT